MGIIVSFEKRYCGTCQKQRVHERLEDVAVCVACYALPSVIE